MDKQTSKLWGGNTNKSDKKQVTEQGWLPTPI